jgi:hypothetical protein
VRPGTRPTPTDDEEAIVRHEITKRAETLRRLANIIRRDGARSPDGELTASARTAARELRQRARLLENHVEALVADRP